MISKPLIEAFQRVKEAVVIYDWSDAIAYAKERYPLVDAVKFRVCFKTNILCHSHLIALLLNKR